MKIFDSEIAALRKGLLQILESGSLSLPDADDIGRGLCFGIAQRVTGSNVYEFMKEFMRSAGGKDYRFSYIEGTLGLTPTRMNIVLLLLEADDDTLRYFYEQAYT